VVLGWALLSEELSVGTLAGAGLIVASVAAIVTRESSHPATEPEPAPVPAHEATTAEDERCIKQPAVVDSVS
jgi:hypothetical protein